MPVQYRFDEKILVIEMSGTYSIDELRSTISSAFKDPARPEDAVLLLDLSASQSFHERSSESVSNVARFVASFGQKFNNRLAIVAPDDLKFGLARMGSATTDNLDIRAEIFRDPAKARAWLLKA